MSLQNKTLAFIGAGNMAEALIRGVLGKNLLPARQIIATDVRAERLSELSKIFGIRTSSDNAAAAREADVIILAVKPQQIATVVPGLSVGRQLVLSIAAGVTTGRIEKLLAGDARVVRVMPNTPALVGVGAAAFSAGRHATAEDLQFTAELLQAVGIALPVEESHLDAVTALSGSGPAYVFFVTEAMVNAGIRLGLTEDVARRLALQTVVGAAQLLGQTGDSPAELRRKVTSPGGTTEAAIKVLTERGLPDLFVAAMTAAARRGKELSAGE